MASGVLVLIPARMASTRLPGKPLADIAGQPMIVHVLRRAQEANLGPVAVATPDKDIAGVVRAVGGQVIMTKADHASGSDRIFEALCKIDPERRARIVVNFQGDMPTLEPSSLRAAVNLLSADAKIDIATLGADLEPDRYLNPNIVKVGGTITDLANPTHFLAKIFARRVNPRISRPSTPHHNVHSVAYTAGSILNYSRPEFFHHIGLYAYRRDALERFVTLPPSQSEQQEQLEQLRAMDAHMRIEVAIVDSVPLGVDTPEELERARAMLADAR